jgi:hypothetical protein
MAPWQGLILRPKFTGGRGAHISHHRRDPHLQAKQRHHTLGHRRSMSGIPAPRCGSWSSIQVSRVLALS